MMLESGLRMVFLEGASWQRRRWKTSHLNRGQCGITMESIAASLCIGFSTQPIQPMSSPTPAEFCFAHRGTVREDIRTMYLPFTVIHNALKVNMDPIVQFLDTCTVATQNLSVSQCKLDDPQRPHELHSLRNSSVQHYIGLLKPLFKLHHAVQILDSLPQWGSRCGER